MPPIARIPHHPDLCLCLCAFPGRFAGSGEVPHPLPLLRGVHVRRQPGVATQLPLLPGAAEPVHSRYEGRGATQLPLLPGAAEPVHSRYGRRGGGEDGAIIHRVLSYHGYGVLWNQSALCRHS